MTQVLDESIPRYRLLEDGFFAPHLIPKGSIVNWKGWPGPHMEPINAAAHAKMEEFYNYEMSYKIKDEATGDTKTVLHRPRHDLRVAANLADPIHEVQVLAPPVKADPQSMTLAALALRKPTSPAIAPEYIAPVPEGFREKAIPTEDGPTLAIVAPPPTLDPRDKSRVREGGSVTSNRS